MIESLACVRPSQGLVWDLAEFEEAAWQGDGAMGGLSASAGSGSGLQHVSGTVRWAGESLIDP